MTRINPIRLQQHYSAFMRAPNLTKRTKTLKTLQHLKLIFPNYVYAVKLTADPPNILTLYQNKTS